MKVFFTCILPVLSFWVYSASIHNGWVAKPENRLTPVKQKIGIPDASFTVSKINGCLNISEIFTQTNPTNTTSWFWDFGTDAVPQTSTTPGPHTVFYTSPGTKTATLKVGNGTTFQIKTVSFIIYPVPTSSFTYIGATNAVPTSLIFTGDTCTNCSYFWDFGDTTAPDNISIKPETVHTYNYSGLYFTTIKTTNSLGCGSTYLQAILINPAVNINTNFTVSPTNGTCVNSKVKITDMSTLPDNSRKWYFGSDAVPTFANNIDTVTVYWKTAGLKKIVLVGGFTTGQNTQQINSLSYMVTDYPDASFTYTGDTSKAPAPISFVANESNGYLYAWDFGDSSSSNNNAKSSRPNHTYSKAGIYTVTLSISHNGCTSYYATNIYIATPIPAIIPAFSIQPSKKGCQSPAVIVTNSSTGVISSYVWNFGANASPANAATKGPFTISYGTPGNKTLKITVGNGTITQSAVMKIKIKF